MSYSKDALNKHLPEQLWHGSAYATERCAPGYLCSRKFLEYGPSGESNHYLYASSERDHAIAYGLAGALRKHRSIERLKFYGRDTILIETPQLLTHYDLEQLFVWLYMLRPTNEQQWIFNHSAASERDSEFKTHRSVPWEQREAVNLKHWLGTKDINLRKV